MKMTPAEHYRLVHQAYGSNIIPVLGGVIKSRVSLRNEYDEMLEALICEYWFNRE